MATVLALFWAHLTTSMSLADWKNLLEALEAGATTLGLIAAALWTYLLFVKKRQRFPRAQLSHRIVREQLSPDRTALALAAGLLTVYSVTWTPRKFVAFVVVWLAFSGVALLASSIRAASQLETIYLHAAGALAGHSDLAAIGAMERTLRQVAASYKGYLLGGKTKAEAIRVFAFRRIPLDVFPFGLSAVDSLSTALQLDAVSVANLVCDVTKAFEGFGAADLPQSLATFISSLHDTAAPPSDFVAAFASSRHLLLGRRLPPSEYFAGLRVALESGVAPAQVGEYLAALGRGA